MIRLCGTPISNYYNKVKLALLEKNIAFEEAMAPPSQEEGMLARSPMGKVPYIEVDGRCLSESQAIVEYLEDRYPASPLYPADAWERAKVRELIHVLELYVDWPARPLIGPVFFGASLSDETRTSVLTSLERGARALNRLTRYSPFLAGGALTYADCAAFTHFRLVSVLTKTIYGRDILDSLPGAAAFLERMDARPHCVRVTGDQMKALEAMRNRKKA